jgi:hypothetical protein
MDKKESIRKFQCIHCDEKPFTTKANMIRHISRKHKNIDLTQQQQPDDNISVLSTDTPIISVNYQSDTETDSFIGGLSPQTGKQETLPSDEYLFNLINEYEKYKHLFPAIHKKLKWNENNSNIDLNYHLRKHNHKFTYILVDLRDAKLPII